IAIGALVPLTGGGAEFGPRMEKAIRLAVDEVNKKTPPMNKKLKVFAEDGQTSPDAAVRAAQKLINVNRVKAVVGTWASAVTLAVAPIAIQSNIALMHTSGANAITDLKSNGLVWRFQPPARLTGKAIAASAKVEGWKTAAAAARNDPSGVSTVESFTREFEAGGGKVLETVTYAPEQTAYSGEVRKLSDANADFVFNSTYAPELTVMAKDAKTNGAEVNWLAPGWAVNKAFIQAVGPAVANGVWAVDSAPNVKTKAYDNFMTAFTKATGDTLVPSDTYVFSAYDMVIVLALAMNDCECDTGKGLTDSILKVTTPGGDEVTSYADGYEALKAGKDINYQGASSNLDFDAKGDQIPLFGLYRVVDGKVALQSTFEVKE
ncbi:MAG TPA: ABC transporter substrate-binding protein, partial [Propionibacteriaceae bacterium]